jgi:hypothetical protein
MKLTAIFIVLVAVATVVSGQTTGSMSTADGLYRFSWTTAGDRITGIITVTTPANTWAAIGFSDDKMMPMSDVIIGGNSNAGQSFVEDRWITDGRTPANVVYDTTQSITAATAARLAGVLTIRFTRPLNTNDATQDVSLQNNCVWVLWAYGGMVNFTTTPVSDLTGHTANGVFPIQLCGCTSIMVSLGVLLLGALIATFATY